MKRLLPLALAVLGATSSVVQADATLVYGLKETMSEAVDQTFSISRFFARVDASGQEGKYLLFQAGKFFPLYSVDTKEGRYTRLTPPVRATLHPAKKTQAPAAQPLAGDDRETKGAKAVEAEPTPEPVEAETVEKEPKAELAVTSGRSGSEVAAAAGGATAADPAQAAVPNEVKPAERPVLPKVPQFKPTRTTDEVAGVRCRVILELIDGKPAIEHCMANTAAIPTMPSKASSMKGRNAWGVIVI